MQFRTLDGKKWYASDMEELAEQLWHSQFIPPATIGEWMVENAKRAMTWDNSPVRWDTIENHMSDLMKAGFVMYESKPKNSWTLRLVKDGE